MLRSAVLLAWLLPIGSCAADDANKAEDDTHVLRLSVTKIDNPEMVPFGIVIDADGKEIGWIGIFPPDQTGDYMLSLSEAELMAAQNGTSLRIEPFETGAQIDIEAEVILQRP